MTENELNDALELFAHKLKNPVHAIGINMDVLRTKLKRQPITDKDIFTHLNIVEKETLRIQEIVQKFTDYLQEDDARKKKVNLKKLLEGK